VSQLPNISPTTNRFLQVAAFVTILGVAIVAVATETQTPSLIRLLIIVGMLGLFTLVQLPLVRGVAESLARQRLLLAGAVALALGLIWV